MNRKFALSLFALSMSSVALAGVKVTSLDLTTSGSNGFIKITLDGRSNELPDVRVYGKTIELSISTAEGFNSIFKNVRGAQLSANSLNGKAIVKATLPYEIPADGVNVGWKNSNIEVIFPRGKAAPETKVSYEGAGVAPKEIQPAKPQPQTPAPAAENKVAANAVAKDSLNEDYLNKLMNEKTAPAKEAAKVEDKKDEINLKQSAIDKAKTPQKDVSSVVPKASASSDNFSFAGYIAKFTIFLAAVLGLFYGIVQLLKKGVFKRGKLGFLNNSQMIEVLSTTYIAPKRSLMVVKAHKQIFLVANSESGFTFLSEMTDTTGLLKEGEKFVTGTNFDMNLGSAETSEEETLIKLKENIMDSTPVSEDRGLSKISVAKDIVKFSDELKKKAKKLKPIEFN